MGNRINKKLGYGFKYCKFSKDPRFNDWVFNNSDKFYNYALKNDFIEFLKQKKEKYAQENNGDYDFDLNLTLAWLEGVGWFIDQTDEEKHKINCLTAADFILFNHYDLDKKNSIGTVIFTDLTSKDWSRYDDIIDYIEANGCESKVKLITDEVGQSCGIYPYMSYANRKTGKDNKFYPVERWTLTSAFLKTRTVNNPSLKHINSPEEYTSFEEAGVTNLIEWQRDIVPKPPGIIKYFCEFMNVFKNPLTVYRLKPMVYTYWS